MIQKTNKALAILIAGRVAQIVIMLISIKISTALLTPSEMGNLYLIVSICSFFGFFFMNPIGQYINRKTHEWHHNGVLLNKLLNYNYYIISASVLSFFVVITLYSLGIANTIDYMLFVLFIPLFVFFNTWNQTIIPMINMLEKRTAFTLLTIATLLISLILSYLIIITYNADGVIWFSGQIVGLGLMAIAALIYFVQKIENNLTISMAHAEITWSNLKHILSFSFPLSIGVLFLWMQNQSYRLIIEKYIGAEFLGYLGVGMAIAIAISSSFEAIVMQFLYPKIYKHMNDEALFKTIFSNTINLILPIYFLIAVFVSFLAIFLTTILVDAKYASSFIFVIFGIWAEFFRISSSLISTIAHSRMQTKHLILPYAVGGVFVAAGTYIISLNQYYYSLFIPILLIAGGFLTFVVMFYTMNKMITIDVSLSNFTKIFPYSLGFCTAIVMYDYAKDLYLSLLIVCLFGIYFLWILYKYFKIHGVTI